MSGQLHGLTGQTRRRAATPTLEPLASPAGKLPQTHVYPQPAIVRSTDGVFAEVEELVAPGGGVGPSADYLPGVLRTSGQEPEPGQEPRRVSFRSPASLVQEKEQDPVSPRFVVKRDAVEEILEKPRCVWHVCACGCAGFVMRGPLGAYLQRVYLRPHNVLCGRRYSAGWYRKAKRTGDDGEGDGGSDDGGEQADRSRPISPVAMETWSLMYQDPGEMLGDLKSRPAGARTMALGGAAQVPPGAAHWVRPAT